MNESTQAAFRAHARAEYPRECCGFIVLVGGVEERYMPCVNVAGAGSKEHFIIAPAQYAEIEDAGKIVALCHSHPDAPATPGPGDKVMCELSGMTWHILRVTAEDAHEMHTMEPCGHEEPLVGRPYLFGVLDCYALVRDWYGRERGIELPLVDRRDRFWERGEDLFAQHYQAAGFYEASAPFQVGDLLVMRVPGDRRKHYKAIDNHAAVYVGDGRILHHMYGRLSANELLDERYQSLLSKVLRHKDMQ